MTDFGAISPHANRLLRLIKRFPKEGRVLQALCEAGQDVVQARVEKGFGSNGTPRGYFRRLIDNATSNANE